jgi:hypothetical protein
MPRTLGTSRSESRRKPRTMPHSPRPSVHKGSESVDDYLKAIFALAGAEGRRVGSTALADRLQVAPASITKPASTPN